MKKIIRLVLGVVLLSAMEMGVCGLENSTPEQRAQLQTAFMKEQLALDPATIAKIQAINLKYAQQAEPVLKGDDNMFKKRSRMMSIMDAKDGELKALLSPAQFDLYEQKKDELKAYMQSHLP
jgi:hypothetical protein